VVLVDQPLVIRGQDGAAAADSGRILGMNPLGLVAVGATVITIPILIVQSDETAPASP